MISSPVELPPGKESKVSIRSLTAGLLLVLAAAPGHAAVLRVPADHATPAAALAGAAAGDTVLVAAGTYTVREAIVPDGVTLRAESGAEVVFDAERKGRHLTVPGAAVVEGIVFRFGAARRDRDPHGGSIDVARGGRLEVRDCRFEECDARRAGGAIHGAEEASLVLERCTFREVDAILPRKVRTKRRESRRQSFGGAVHVARDGSLTATDCGFSETTASDAGGALYFARDSKGTLTRCRFESGRSNNGGAIHAERAELEILDGSFRNHSTSSEFADPGLGAAVRLNGGSLRLVGSVLQGNVSARGAALGSNGAATIILERSRFLDNEGESGGAVAVVSGTLEIRDCAFLRNRATDGAGAAVLSVSASLQVRGVTFHGNGSTQGGSAIHVVSAPEPPIVEACLFSAGGGDAPMLSVSGPPPEPRCCLVFGHDGGDWMGDLARAQDRNGNVSADPQLADPSADDVTPREGSPATGGDCERIGAPADVAR